MRLQSIIQHFTPQTRLIFFKFEPPLFLMGMKSAETQLVWVLIEELLNAVFVTNVMGGRAGKRRNGKGCMRKLQGGLLWFISFKAGMKRSSEKAEWKELF